MEHLSVVVDALTIVVRGFPVVLLLVAMAILPALAIGIVGGLSSNAPFSPLRMSVTVYVYIFRSTPFLMLIFIVYYGLPHYGLEVSAMTTAVVSLALCHGAYFAEIVRGGLLGFDKGQSEAARSLGFSRWQALRDVVLPQTLMSVVPTMLGQSIHMVKDTALVSILGISELTKLGKDVVIRTNSPFLVFPVVALSYFVLCYTLQYGAKLLEAYGRKRIG